MTTAVKRISRMSERDEREKEEMLKEDLEQMAEDQDARAVRGVCDIRPELTKRQLRRASS